MVPRPAIPARVTPPDTLEKTEKIAITEVTEGMVPNLQVYDSAGNKTFGPPEDPSKQVIDLTEEPDEELKKAIALSLLLEKERNTTLITQEQADIDRAVAESISENSHRRHAVTLRETQNPKDKVRDSDWPVGLKNVGNTCWFSAVIQSLFYIPEFRRLVLQFTPQKIDCKELDTRGLRNVNLVTNLRRLFALMLRGKRKYLDPSDCISILKSGLGDSFSQHDVSETTHLLLQWLEEAFSLWNKKIMEEEGTEKGQMELESETKGESSSSHMKNPLIGLFYGQVAVESVDGSGILSRMEQYSQCIIQASGMSDLHQGIEASTKESVESSPLIENHASPSFKSSQSYKVLRSKGMIRERWFQDLPPVLTFELKRFSFNSVSQKPEKIHDRVIFPKRIFMDRYMRENREKTVEIRGIAEELALRKHTLEEKINHYEHYGTESEKYSLPRVLRYAKHFLESRKPRTDVLSQPLPTHSGANSEFGPTTDASGSPNRRRSLSALETEADHDSKRRRYLSDEEFRLVDTCLAELHEEVCLDLEQFSKDVARLDTKMERLYDRPDLQKVPYSLHAVMVHGGEAASGHYWSYIWDENRETWLKFNDHLVTEASWTDLEKDAYGGPHTKASAYCLIYLDEKKKETLLGSNVENELPDDLIEFLEDDCSKLDEECRSWEEKQREQPMEVDESHETIQSDKTTEVDATALLDINKWEVVPPGSSFDVEKKSLEAVYMQNPEITPHDAWGKLLEFEYLAYQQVTKMMSLRGQEDHRAINFACYVAVNGFSNLISFVCLVLLNRFLALVAGSSEQATELLELAHSDLVTTAKTLSGSDVTELTILNRSYKDFVIDVHGFIFAVECIRNKNKYDQCVPVLSRMYIDGKGDRALGVHRRLSASVILKCLRLCLHSLSNCYIDQFRHSESGEQLISEIQMTLVPGIVVLSQSAEEPDRNVVELIRCDWCGLLSDGVDEPSLEKILQQLLDCRESLDLINNLPSTPIHRLNDLHRVFNDALHFIESIELS